MGSMWSPGAVSSFWSFSKKEYTLFFMVPSILSFCLIHVTSAISSSLHFQQFANFVNVCSQGGPAGRLKFSAPVVAVQHDGDPIVRPGYRDRQAVHLEPEFGQDRDVRVGNGQQECPFELGGLLQQLVPR